MANKLFTIGYSGFPKIEEFLNTLKQYNVQVLIDVRSIPKSALFIEYDKEHLKSLLEKNHIYYLNYSKQFGARQTNPAFYNSDGRLDFKRFSKSVQFMDGVSRVNKSKANICFMCAEKDPAECHRAILVSKAFSDRGYEITHILPNGKDETQHDIDRELLNQYFPTRNQISIINNDNKTEEEYIEEAYKLRNDQIGFKLGDLKP